MIIFMNSKRRYLLGEPLTNHILGGGGWGWGVDKVWVEMRKGWEEIQSGSGKQECWVRTRQCRPLSITQRSPHTQVANRTHFESRRTFRK